MSFGFEEDEGVVVAALLDRVIYMRLEAAWAHGPDVGYGDRVSKIDDDLTQSLDRRAFLVLWVMHARC